MSPSPPTGPTTISTESLSEKERAGLNKDYQFMVRGKAALLIPTSGPSPIIAQDSSFASGGQKYQRYLAAAIDLHKSGRLEEAMKILAYLNESDPGDEYVRSYLARVRREVKSNDSVWKDDTAKEAASMKRNRIQSLMRDGVDFYNSNDFDSAMVCFNDLLAADPGNATAKKYMQKLKDYYLKKLEAEEMVSGWENKKFSDSLEKPDWPPYGLSSSPLKNTSAVETILNGAQAKNMAAVEALLDDIQAETVHSGRKAEEILQEVELGMETDAIIAAKRAEEIRADQMTLGSGDILKLSVVNHPELSGDMTVQSNGCVNLPLVGDELAASGGTINELSDKVTQAMGKYIDAPKISLSVLLSKSQMFYVIDEISCTPYPIPRPNFTVRDALFLSDWGDGRALGRILIIKPSARNPVVKKVDAFNMIFRGDLKDNIRIANGDVIYIPLTAAAKITKVVYDTISPFAAAMSARDEFLGAKWNRQDYKQFFRMPNTPGEMSPSADTGGGGGTISFNN